MEVFDKLRILGAGAKYDASCSSSGSARANAARGIGNAARSGICHSWSDDGRCISLLKILLTNYCIYDCAYCANRRSNDIERAIFTADEVVNLTVNFYKRNYIEGLFLSSGIYRSPDTTMETLLLVLRKLRGEQNFHGYIHVKAIPGASETLVREAGLLADRMSVNIELPSEQSLKALAPQKNGREIFRSMSYIENNIEESREENKKNRKAKIFVPAGQSTQVIIGASPETDLNIIKMSENLYSKISLKRVYYSAYMPVNNDKLLPAVNITPPLLREHRLYQADWLLRFYGFNADEILARENPFLDLDFDPKTAWALRNMKLFPVEVNRAEHETILRIPGIGVKSAKRILQARKFSVLNFEGLKKMGVVLKRARYFITCGGKFLEDFDQNEDGIRQRMLAEKTTGKKSRPDELYLFEQIR